MQGDRFGGHPFLLRVELAIAGGGKYATQGLAPMRKVGQCFYDSKKNERSFYL